MVVNKETHPARKHRNPDRRPMPLDTARTAFDWLVTGPAPVSIDGRLFPGMPPRRVPLHEVRDRLLHRRCPQATRDAVWAHLVLRSRTEGATWTVGCVGVALPALTRTAARLSARFAGDVTDIHAAVLTGFLAELAHLDLRKPRIMLRLRWAAYRAGHTAVRDALTAPRPAGTGLGSAAPAPPSGHPDFVLARAVADGVLDRDRGRVDRCHPAGRTAPGHRRGGARGQLPDPAPDPPARRAPAGRLPARRHHDRTRVRPRPRGSGHPGPRHRDHHPRRAGHHDTHPAVTVGHRSARWRGGKKSGARVEKGPGIRSSGMRGDTTHPGHTRPGRRPVARRPRRSCRCVPAIPSRRTPAPALLGPVRAGAAATTPPARPVAATAPGATRRPRRRRCRSHPRRAARGGGSTGRTCR